jgi:pimeloyl-ACP methyl ester carboxylesterase
LAASLSVGQALSEAGRWVIAPDQRGYGLTDAPARV